MAKKTDEDGQLLEDLREMSIETAVSRLEAIHRLKGGGQSGGSRGGRAEDHEKPDELDLAFDTLRFVSHTYERWKRLEGRHFDFLLRTLGKPAAGCDETGSHLTVELTVKSAGTASRRFSLENPSRRRELAVVPLPKLAHVTNGADFTGDLELKRLGGEPDDFFIDAGKTATFVLSVTDTGGRVGRYYGEEEVGLGPIEVGTLAVSVRVKP